MTTATKAALAILLTCGGLLLVLGVLFWTEKGYALIDLHIGLGIVLVLTLWAIAFMAARARVPAPTVAFATAWGLLVVVLGLAQEELVPGRWHWTIQVLHLVVSMGAIWWGRRLVRLIGQAGDRAEAGTASTAMAAGPTNATTGRRQ